MAVVVEVLSFFGLDGLVLGVLEMVAFFLFIFFLIVFVVVRIWT